MIPCRRESHMSSGSEAERLKDRIRWATVNFTGKSGRTNLWNYMC